MSAGLARNWWTVGLRGIAAVTVRPRRSGVAVLDDASLVLLFAAYVGRGRRLRDFRRRARRAPGRALVDADLEGVTNLTVAGAVLVWLALAVVPLVSLASAWAVVTGALMLAAAHRLSDSHGRWLLAFGGGVSAGWGALAAPGTRLGWRSADDGAVAGRLRAGVWRHAPGPRRHA